jgi:hypothetical protein
MARKQQPRCIPANIWNELRRLLAVKCLSYVFACEKMKVKDQQRLVEERYHGEEPKRVISHEDLLCKGQGVYAYLYEEREDQVTGSPSSSTGEGKLQLKTLLTRSNVPYLAGEHITCQVMERASFTGKQIREGCWALYELAYIPLRNLCEASARLRKYIKADGNPNASGHSKEDVVRLLLDHMYMELKGKPSMVEADVSDNESDENDGTEVNNGSDAIDGTS